MQTGGLHATLSNIVGNLLIAKIVEALVLVAITYLIMLVIKTLLMRLQQREVITSAVREQVYRLLSLILYGFVLLFIVYMFTSAHEVFYFILLLTAAALFSNWRLIANVTAYYVMLLGKHPQRAAQLIEFPRLRIRGRIVEITPLYLKLRGPSGRLYHIPNSVALEEPTVIVAGIQTMARLSVLIEKLPEGESIENIEKKIRSTIEESQLVPRARDVVIRVKEISKSGLLVDVEIPLVGSEPRPGVVNALVHLLYQGLSEYAPRIRVEE